MTPRFSISPCRRWRKRVRRGGVASKAQSLVGLGLGLEDKSPELGRIQGVLALVVLIVPRDIAALPDKGIHDEGLKAVFARVGRHFLPLGLRRLGGRLGDPPLMNQDFPGYGYLLG